MTAGRQLSSIGVAGQGTTGAGIAEVLARQGCAVTGVALTEGDLA